MNLEKVHQTSKRLLLEEAARRGYTPAGIAALQNPEISLAFYKNIVGSYMLTQKKGQIITDGDLRFHVNYILDILSEHILPLMELCDEEMIKDIGREQSSERIDSNIQGRC